MRAIISFFILFFSACSLSSLQEKNELNKDNGKCLFEGVYYPCLIDLFTIENVILVIKKYQSEENINERLFNVDCLYDKKIYKHPKQFYEDAKSNGNMCDSLELSAFDDDNRDKGVIYTLKRDKFRWQIVRKSIWVH